MEISNPEILNSMHIICSFFVRCLQTDGWTQSVCLVGGYIRASYSQCFLKCGMCCQFERRHVFVTAVIRTKIFGKRDKMVHDLNFLIALHPLGFPVTFSFLHVCFFVWFQIPELSMSFCARNLAKFY